MLWITLPGKDIYIYIITVLHEQLCFTFLWYNISPYTIIMVGMLEGFNNLGAFALIYTLKVFCSEFKVLFVSKIWLN